MNKRFTTLVFLVLVAFSVNAQLSLTVQEPPSGVVQKNQLWNMSVIYSGTNTINVTIGLSLVDLSDNQPVLTAFTRPITLSKGIRQLRLADISPVDYTFQSPAFSRLTNNFLPVGNYSACYTIYSGDSHATILSDNCITLEVLPLSPPQLTMPADSAIIENLYPQFSWLPPVPPSLFIDLNYDILVTEVRNDQTPGAAIQENIPVYNARRLMTVVNNYPSSNKSLDTGKVYAWRVIAKNGENFAAQSDVWTFKLATRKPQTLVPPNGIYIELKNDGNYSNTNIIEDNILGIKYYSYDKTHDAVVRFFNESGDIIKEIKKTLQYGNNFIVFKLDHAFGKEAIYFIEVTDLQMSRYRASFKMSN
jgi:hypothetical protein